MTQAVLPQTHPVLRCAEEIGAALDTVADCSPVYMTTEAKGAALLALSRQVARLESLRLRVLAAADDVASETGARSSSAWLAHRTRMDHAAARRLERLAARLERYHAVATALAAGEVGIDQAEVIVACLEELPADLPAGTRVAAERRLVADGREFDPKRLRTLGRRILEVVAPGVAEEHERRLLEREERRARLKCRITRRRLGGGLSRAVVDLPDATMDLWMSQLHAYASPRRDHLGETDPGAPVDASRRDPETGERLGYPELLARAFCALLEHVPTDRLPQHGGSPVGMVVQIDFSVLQTGLGAAELSTGGRISAAEARRLACDAQILPMVLGGRSAILDLGRGRRLFSPAQRRAMAVRDGGCRAEGCDIPAAWAEAHHLDPWSAGGRTDLADGVLLCSFHHHRAHDRRFVMARTGSGDIRYHRRT